MVEDTASVFRGEQADLRSAMVIFGACLLFSIALLWLATGNMQFTAIFAAGLIGTFGIGWVLHKKPTQGNKAHLIAPDWSITHEASAHHSIASAITDENGNMVSANRRFMDIFGSQFAPPGLDGLRRDDMEKLREAGRAAWRDGYGLVQAINAPKMRFDAEISRIGAHKNYLLWRLSPLVSSDLLNSANQMVVGKTGRLLAKSGVMAVVIGAEGRISSANNSFALRATGQPEGQVIGRDLAGFLAADEHQHIMFQREGHQGRSLRLINIPLIDPEHDDHEQHLEDESALILLLDEDSAMLDRRTILEYIQNLMMHMPVGLAMVDRDGRFIMANPAFAKTTDSDPQNLPAWPSDLVINEDKSALADAVRRHAGGKKSSSDVTVRLRHQSDEPVQISIASLRNMGEATALLMLRDNSEEAKFKRQMAQASKMQAIGQLAGGVAHDFNNVLTAIIGHCDLMLLRHSPGDSDYDDIQQIKNNSNRAAGLTRQLLAFSRQQTLRPQILQLPDIVADVSKLLQRLLGEKITLEILHDRNLGPIRADPVQLEQVIINLAVNARDAIDGARRDSGNLSIQTKRITPAHVRTMDIEILPPDNYSCLWVEDNGAGMSPDIAAKIFEPFFTTKDIGKGTGLGLSTVYGIVKQSGGYIFADSAPGKGSVFSIYFPVYHGEAKESALPAKIEPPVVHKQWGDARILLVEDEEMVRAVAERALSRQGYKVITAADGEEGLERFGDSGPFDLVLSDVVMPNMDGPAMAARLRQLQADLPILFMSGYAEEQLRQSISLDDVHFLPKPFSVNQIVDKVGQSLSRKI